MKDVAARAGVSYQTVSRVVNESPHVKLETHARVAEAMGELRYLPNNAARHLVSRRSRIIGFIGSLTFHGPVRIMVSVEQTAKKHGYNVMFAELPEVNAAEVRRAIDELCARQVDGIVILIPPELEMDFIRDVCRDVPFIAIDVDLGPSLPAVSRADPAPRSTANTSTASTAPAPFVPVACAICGSPRTATITSAAPAAVTSA